MAKARSLVGLDMHATKIVAAVLDADTGQLQTFAMSGDTAGAVDKLRSDRNRRTEGDPDDNCCLWNVRDGDGRIGKVSPSIETLSRSPETAS